MLVAEGFGHHVPKGYIYFAMGFSLAVEMMNITMRKRAANKVKLRQPDSRWAGLSETVPDMLRGAPGQTRPLC